MLPAMQPTKGWLKRLTGEKNFPLILKDRPYIIWVLLPAKPGGVIGAAGPTTSGRMDVYAPRLMEIGLKGMIGKGARTQPVLDAIKKYKAVYFAGLGGAGALISKCIKKAEVIAYDDLVQRLCAGSKLLIFPATVINDMHGGNLYEEGKAKYALSMGLIYFKHMIVYLTVIQRYKTNNVKGDFKCIGQR